MSRARSNKHSPVGGEPQDGGVVHFRQLVIENLRTAELGPVASPYRQATAPGLGTPVSHGKGKPAAVGAELARGPTGAFRQEHRWHSVCGVQIPSKCPTVPGSSNQPSPGAIEEGLANALGLAPEIPSHLVSHQGGRAACRVLQVPVVQSGVVESDDQLAPSGTDGKGANGIIQLQAQSGSNLSAIEAINLDNARFAPGDDHSITLGAENQISRSARCDGYRLGRRVRVAGIVDPDSSLPCISSRFSGTV
jgi:hypothetical protein